MKTKICGITQPKDAVDAISLGADAIGLIFYRESPRYITPEKAVEITASLPPFVQVVGVFVNEREETIQNIASTCKLNVIQLHGEESPEFCKRMPRRVIKGFRVNSPEDIEHIAAYQNVISAALLDTKVEKLHGGTGKSFDWGLALEAKKFDIPIILAGGINIDNIKKAVQMVNPYAIDLSSSVEISPGIKDYNKVSEILSLSKGL